MKKHYAPTSTGKVAPQPEPVAPVHLDKIPVTVPCQHCRGIAVYGVRLTKGDAKYDVYFCDTCEGETRIPVQ